MTDRELKIKEAYGEHWDKVKNYIDSDGWLETYDYVITDTMFDFLKLQVKLNNAYKFRPNSLNGIDTNNRWIKIESEDDLPKDIIDCFVMKDGLIFYPLVFRTDLQQFQSVDESCYDWQDISHWQPLKEPLKPIY